MKYESISTKIIELKDDDLNLRNELIQSGELRDGYHREMEDYIIEMLRY